MAQQEQHARQTIDELLQRAGWTVGDVNINILAHRGVAIREFPLKSGHGFADYLLYVDGRVAGVIEAKKQGVTLSGVETQSDKYTQGLPAGRPYWHNPLPFAYQSTGIETRFTNGMDPEPGARPVFAFHEPETLVDWLDVGRITERSDQSASRVADATPPYSRNAGTFLAKLQHCPCWSKKASGPPRSAPSTIWSSPCATTAPAP